MSVDFNAPARPASIAHAGRTWTLDAADAARIEALARGAPGTRWSATVLRTRHAHPELPAYYATELAAAALAMDGETLRARLPGWGRALLVPSEVVLDGRTYVLSADDAEIIDSALSTGTWHVTTVYGALRARTGHDGAALALTALALGESEDSVRGSIEWNEGYMRMRDG